MKRGLKMDKVVLMIIFFIIFSILCGICSIAEHIDKVRKERKQNRKEYLKNHPKCKYKIDKYGNFVK